MAAYSKLLGLWSPLYRSLACEATILHLPDFDQLTVANLVNLLLMEEPTDNFVWFNIEQMELIECLNIKLSGLTKVPKRAEVKETKRMTKSSGTVLKNVAKSPENVLTPPALEIETEEPVNYMCDLCDSKVTSIEKHMESEHEEIMPIPIAEIRAFFSIIPVTKFRKSESENSFELQKSDTSNVGVGSDEAEGVKCPECPRRFNSHRFKDNLRCHIGSIHFSDQLLEEAEKYYISDKCKECGHIGKSNTQKKKHLHFKHTKYVSVILTATENAIKSHDNRDKKWNENTEALLQEDIEE